MTQIEFYENLMKDIEYIFTSGFVNTPETFQQTVSYASEHYELLLAHIKELEDEIQSLHEDAAGENI